MSVGRFVSSDYCKSFSISKCPILDFSKIGNHCIILHLFINIHGILSYLLLELLGVLQWQMALNPAQ